MVKRVLLLAPDGRTRLLLLVKGELAAVEQLAEASPTASGCSSPLLLLLLAMHVRAESACSCSLLLLPVEDALCGVTLCCCSCSVDAEPLLTREWCRKLEAHPAVLLQR